MLTRTSNVDHLEVKQVAFSSIIQLGDSSIINGFSRALAVQREAEIFFGDEGNFPSYRIFKKPLPLPPITESMSFFRHDLNPIIKVNKLHVTAVSSSSILHVGNSRYISLEARIKHIRQLLLEGHEQDI
ncbi:spore germination protein GerPE [Neobacillus vireti]|uniref:Spore germination protein n=1 Tax=Neobacillus vireti LMG 21834 TaxID=1131730 RepID=A0AB94INP3_9BACI|nr:spore germination protein GerPE [Neobacillus vireti]ETI68674.1 spore germination protein [Neobacillus vireti LMG 21834]KLT19203.1 spore gernimation protein [Neobacillus vireti]